MSNAGTRPDIVTCEVFPNEAAMRASSPESASSTRYVREMWRSTTFSKASSSWLAWGRRRRREGAQTLPVAASVLFGRTPVLDRGKPAGQCHRACPSACALPERPPRPHRSPSPFWSRWRLTSRAAARYRRASLHTHKPPPGASAKSCPTSRSNASRRRSLRCWEPTMLPQQSKSSSFLRATHYRQAILLAPSPKDIAR